MSFRTWALANPTKTWGYKHLQNLLGNYQRSLAENQEALAKAEAGIMPDWATKRSDHGLKIAKQIVLFSEILPPLFGMKEMDEKERKEYVQQRRAERWEREAVEAEEREKRDREITLQVEKDHRQRDIDNDKGNIAELEQQLKDYKVDERLFEYCQWDEFEFVQQCLEARLRPLGINETIDMDMYFDHTIEDVSLKLGIKASLFFNTNRYRWVAKVEDDSVSFTRLESTLDYNGAMVAAFMYAILKYLDYKWDDLVEQHAP